MEGGNPKPRSGYKGGAEEVSIIELEVLRELLLESTNRDGGDRRKGAGFKGVLDDRRAWCGGDGGVRIATKRARKRLDTEVDTGNTPNTAPA